MANVFFPDKKTSNLRLVAGTVALDGTNPTTVTISEVSTIVGAIASLNVAAPPGASTSTLGVTWSGNVLTIEGYKPTGAGDTALVDSDGTQSVSYLVMGH